MFFWVSLKWQTVTDYQSLPTPPLSSLSIANNETKWKSAKRQAILHGFAIPGAIDRYFHFNLYKYPYKQYRYIEYMQMYDWSITLLECEMSAIVR